MNNLKVTYDKYLINKNGIFACGWIYSNDLALDSVEIKVIENNNASRFCEVLLGNSFWVKSSSHAKPRLKTSYYFFAPQAFILTNKLFLEAYYENGEMDFLVLPTSYWKSRFFFYRKRIEYYVNGISINWFKHNIKHILFSFSSKKEISENIVKPPKIVTKSLVKSEKEKVLVIDHLLGGGANYFRDEWIKNVISADREVYLLGFSILDLSFNLFYIDKIGKRQTKNVAEFEEISTLLSNLELVQIYVNNLVAFPDPIHIISVIRKISFGRNIPITIAVHDYFSLCPSFNLLNTEGKFCNLPSVSVCNACLSSLKTPLVAYTSITDIELWREAWNSLLKCKCEIHCFSESSKQLFLKCFPDVGSKVKVIPHAVAGLSQYKPAFNQSPFINIGIIGQIQFNKGAEVIKAIYALIVERNLPIRLIIVGSIIGEFKEPYLVQTGNYSVTALPSLIEKYSIDYAFMPSIWPETFSYVAHEIKSMGLPMVTFNLGAQADLAKSYEKGYVIDLGDPEEIINQLTVFHQTLKKI